MSQPSSMHTLWTEGMYGQYVEELIAGSFNDFAPYAGADVQRLSVTRQIADEAQASVQFEENGDLVVTGTHRQAGAMGFSTSHIGGASSQRADVNICVPLVLSGSHVPTSSADAIARFRDDAQSQTPALPADIRFFDHHRGAQLVQGLQRYLGLGHAMSRYKSVGQLEVSGSLLPTVWTTGRQAYSLRCGPLAARLTMLPYPAQLRAPVTEDASTSSAMDTGASQSALNRSKRPSYHYTMEAAACVPLPSWLATTTEAGDEKSGKAARIPPMACTVAVQHPFLMGDSLVGVALQTDRTISVARRLGIPSEADPAQPDSAQRVVRFPTVASSATPSASGGSANGAGAFDLITYTEAETTVRALLVQTVASKWLQASDASVAATNVNSTLGADGLYYSVMSHDGAWTSLPTLVGLSASFRRSLLRVSLAGIFHDGSADVEAAVVADVTPWMPTTPSVVRVGWNNVGRVAVGITSLFYDALAVTLGVHAMPGDGVRFGVEISF